MGGYGIGVGMGVGVQLGWTGDGIGWGRKGWGSGRDEDKSRGRGGGEVRGGSGGRYGIGWGCNSFVLSEWEGPKARSQLNGCLVQYFTGSHAVSFFLLVLFRNSPGACCFPSQTVRGNVFREQEATFSWAGLHFHGLPMSL